MKIIYDFWGTNYFYYIYLIPAEKYEPMASFDDHTPLPIQTHIILSQRHCYEAQD